MTKVRQSYPDTIRIMITGYPGLDSAIEAINKGQVYRYIPKPWENKELELIVKQALEYYDVLRDNRILLRIARQQAEWLTTVKKQNPQVSDTELAKGDLHVIDEEKVSESLAQFLKRYYPQGIKENSS